MKRILLFLVCLFLTTNATAICPKKDIEVAFKKKYGKPIYNYNLTHKDFEKYSPAPMSKIVRGLTIGELGVSYGAQGRVFKHKDGYCAGVKKVDFYIGYDYFKVFVDKKYKRNTCEFRAVKLHEDEHVAIFNAAVEFFAPDIQKAIKKAVAEIQPEKVYSQARAQQVFDKQANEVLNKIQPLLKHVNKKIVEKQGLIDTDEAYMKVQKKCNNW